MAFAYPLSSKGHQPQSVETQALRSLEPQEAGGFKITKIRPETQAKVPDIDEVTLHQIAQEAEAGCPVSNALRGGVAIELNASLV